MSDFSMFDVAGISFFATGLFCGYLLTALAPMTVSNWAVIALVRVVWQLGGAVWCAIILGRAFDTGLWMSIAMGILGGLLLCYNPVLDLIRGPLDIEGQLVDATVTRGTFVRPLGSNKSIRARVCVEVNGETALDIEPAGLQANRWQDLYAACGDPAGPVHIVALRHLDVVLALRCR